ncbi:histidinol-phosphate transaminase [Streptomyces sp. NPDC046862]|uniref:histidinol-phosphate transaminase n=1 Tax=Streptomyces sp. NPDC046862 TaxID=3154603 RepID=UPI0034513520
MRAHLEALPKYRPGRAPADGGQTDFVQLASNESPFGPLDSVRAAMAAQLDEVNRYPDFAGTQLVTALAGLLNVPQDAVAVGTGSSALIRDLIWAFAGRGDEVVFADPSFPLYRNVTIATGAVPVTVPLSEHRHDLAAMAARVTDRTRVVLVCTPNNPTGTVAGAEELRSFVNALPDHVLVVVDEAYREYVDDPTAADGVALAAQHPNVVALRTFSKAYGLAGLRVGYLVGAPQIVDLVRRLGIPFGVSALAQAAALASLTSTAREELHERVTAVVRERERVHAFLEATGFSLPRSHANFLYLPVGSLSARFAAACQERGVLVRPCPEGALRVTIGTAAENDQFLKAAVDVSPSVGAR